MSNLINHATRELELAGLTGVGSIYGGNLAKQVLELLKIFVSQGHSGMSASIAAQLFKQLANFEPLTPLTGEESEWCGGQNKRKFSVFLDKDGKAFDIRTFSFSRDGETTWSCAAAHKEVKFPYTHVPPVLVIIPKEVPEEREDVWLAEFRRLNYPADALLTMPALESY